MPGFTCGAWGAVALIGVDQIDAAPSVLTRVTVTLLHLDVADGAGVSWVTLTGESGDTIFTDTVMTRLRHAVIDVFLTENSSKT